MQFNMNKSEISDDSRLFKIQGDLNLIDHEINSVRVRSALSYIVLCLLAGCRRPSIVRVQIVVLGRRHGPYGSKIGFSGSDA
jgi:hypothetical protein